MKKNSSYTLFLAFMFMGIMISVSANNWLSCWMGIEINMVSFLPIMMNKMSIYASESMIKYFIVQSVGSSMLLISIIMMNMMNGLIYIIMISLMIKIGSPPFHYWYVSVIEGLSWMSSFILMTVQKIIPMVLLSYLNINLSLFIIFSCVWGSIGGLMYSSMRKIVAYSSIYNLGWIFSGIMTVNYSWLIYFIIYSMTLMIICYMFSMYNINYINQFIMSSCDFVKSTMMMSIFMSMGGLPPFLGFFPKMIMIYCLLINNMLFICMLLLMSALVVLFFYLRIIMTGLTMNVMMTKMLLSHLTWMGFIFGILTVFGSMILLLLMFNLG